MKFCNNCNKTKKIKEFSKNSVARDGLHRWCKPCVSEYCKNRYINKKEEISKKASERYIRNRDLIIKRVYKYKKERLKVDPVFKMIENLRHRIYNVLKNNYKSARTMELLGCTTKFAKDYIELKFTENMSWDNYGQWHIDHIFPCSSFDLSKPEEQKKCFHYTNLQPLWAKDNLKKSNKREQYNGTKNFAVF